jgi:A/G-specific adenine glycosylase
MPGMYELPPLLLDGAEDVMTEREPVLRVRHAITNTNYYVKVYAPRGPEDRALRRTVSAGKEELHWVMTSHLGTLPLTGLTKKVLQRLDVMAVRPLRQADLEPVAKRSPKAAAAVLDWDEEDSF